VVPPRKPWWKFTGNKAAAVGLLAMISMGGLLNNYAALLGHDDITAADVHKAPIGRYIRVTCDDITDGGTIVARHNKPTDHMFACATSEQKFLIVLSDPDVTTLDKEISGKLHRLYDAGITSPTDLRDHA